VSRALVAATAVRGCSAVKGMPAGTCLCAPRKGVVQAETSGKGRLFAFRIGVGIVKRRIRFSVKSEP